MWRPTNEAREHVAEQGARIGLEESLPMGVKSDSAVQRPLRACMMMRANNGRS
jgi:hypothetical protein